MFHLPLDTTATSIHSSISQHILCLCLAIQSLICRSPSIFYSSHAMRVTLSDDLGSSVRQHTFETNRYRGTFKGDLQISNVTLKGSFPYFFLTNFEFNFKATFFSLPIFQIACSFIGNTNFFSRHLLLPDSGLFPTTNISMTC